MTSRSLLPARLVLLIVAALVTSAVASAETEPAAEGPALRMAMSGAFQPFSTTDASGVLVGFDADIAREVARRLKRTPMLIQTDWTGIQAGLQSGKYELICGSMAIIPQRLKTMYFSLPYYVSGAQIFVRRGLEALDGARIGVTEDSTYASHIKKHPDQFPRARVIYYGSEAEIVAAMNADKVDAFVSDLIVGGFYVKQGGQGRIVPQGGLLYQEACGIAARQDEGDLVHEVNAALLAMVQDGTYTRLYKKWVGTAPDLCTLLASWGEFACHIPPPVDSALVSADLTESRLTFADSAQSMLPMLSRGAILTLELSLLTAVLAFFTGALTGVGTVSRSRILRTLAAGYISIIRGTPLLVQLFIAYFVIATAINRLVGAEVVGAFAAALIALVINTTAYNAETLRGGINSVEKGQWDAAASLGMTRAQIMRRIVLPQALRNSLPSLGNNLVVLIKDTSLVGAITLIELTYAARNVVFQTGQAFLPFVLAGVFYLTIISLVTLLMKRWESHYARSRQQGGQTA